MERLREDHGLVTIQRALRFLSLRVRSRPQSAPLAAEVDVERDALSTRADAYEDAWEKRVAATAEITYLDAMLGVAVADLAREVNVMVKGRTDDPRYQRIFLGPPSERMKPVGGAEQDRFVANVLTCLKSDKDFASLKGHAAPITDWQRQLADAFANREKLQLAEDRAHQELDIAINKARKAYNLMEHRLALLFPDNPALVDSFFWSSVRAPVTPRMGDAPAQPVTPGAPPANHDGAANTNDPQAHVTRSARTRRRRTG